MFGNKGVPFGNHFWINFGIHFGTHFGVDFRQFLLLFYSIPGRFLDSFWFVCGSVLADFDTAVVADCWRRFRSGLFTPLS